MLKKNYTRKDLANKVYQHLGLSKNISSIIVDDFFESLVSELIELNKVKQLFQQVKQLVEWSPAFSNCWMKFNYLINFPES